MLAIPRMLSNIDNVSQIAKYGFGIGIIGVVACVVAGPLALNANSLRVVRY